VGTTGTALLDADAKAVNNRQSIFLSHTHYYFIY
jgi:hypothetical protein